MYNYIICTDDRTFVKQIKSCLESNKCLNKKLKICVDSTGVFQIPVLISDIDNSSHEKVESYFKNILKGFLFTINQVETSSILENDDSQDTILLKLEKLFLLLKIDSNRISTKTLLDQFPKRYSIYTPLLLLPPNSLDTPEWTEFLNMLDEDDKLKIFHLILDYFSTPTNNLTHLAINKPIPKSDNVIRSPSQLTTLYGDFKDFWCHTTQNGIYQTWMPIHTMFSRGNIKEKARILSSYENITNKTDIVDLYAGIGYFTLSYLKRNAKRVYCWEINPYSVEGLARGVKNNGFGDAYVIKRDEPVILEKVLKSKCIVFLESNAYCISRFQELLNQGGQKLDLNISHINLGLLPTSTDSWPYASKLIDLYGDTNSWLHVHENIGIDDLETFMDKTEKILQGMTQTTNVEKVWLEKVKTFAPEVYHVVGDFNFKKKNKNRVGFD